MEVLRIYVPVPPGRLRADVGIRPYARERLSLGGIESRLDDVGIRPYARERAGAGGLKNTALPPDFRGRSSRRLFS